MTDADHPASGADARSVPPHAPAGPPPHAGQDGAPPHAAPDGSSPAALAWGPSATSLRPGPVWGTEIAVGTAVMVAVAVFGVLLGLLWHAVTPGAEIAMTADGPVHANPNSEDYFADDAWFGLISAVTGVLAAIVCWTTVRRYRGPAVLVGLVAGCLLSAVIAWQVGRQIGLDGFRQLLDNAAVGVSFRRPSTLSAFGVLGVQGFTAAFTYTLLAGWSRYPGLRRPPEPWGGPWPVTPAPPADSVTGQPAPDSRDAPDGPATGPAGGTAFPRR